MGLNMNLNNNESLNDKLQETKMDTRIAQEQETLGLNEDHDLLGVTIDEYGTADIDKELLGNGDLPQQQIKQQDRKTGNDGSNRSKIMRNSNGTSSNGSKKSSSSSTRPKIVKPTTTTTTTNSTSNNIIIVKSAASITNIDLIKTSEQFDNQNITRDDDKQEDNRQMDDTNTNGNDEKHSIKRCVPYFSAQKPEYKF
jgi:hypothetical protein